MSTFHPNHDRQLADHSGRKITKQEPLDELFYDRNEVGPMFVLELEGYDGVVHAFADEIQGDVPTLEPLTEARPYGWTGFEPEPDGTGDGEGDPDKMIGIIGLWAFHDGHPSLDDEIAVIVHRTCNGTYPLDGALAQQKELIALHIVKLLNDNPIDFDAILEGIDYERANVASAASHQVP